MYDEGADLHRGMKIPTCPNCGARNPQGSKKGDYIWQEVRMDDSCMWQLKGRTWTSNMELEEMQEVVGGRIEYYPAQWLQKDVVQMVVNEEGLLLNLRYNDLATMQTLPECSPVAGNVLIKIPRELTTKEYWLKGEDE